jgi:RimJ/RimL family protein N-acetyltransferase
MLEINLLRMHRHRTPKVSLRQITKKDWDFILQLRNRPEFRKGFYDQHTITKKEHYKYLQKQKTNPNFVNWIICYGKNDVGYVRILDNDVSIMISKEYNSKGIGTKALRLVEREARRLGMKKLVGRIMIHNKASQRIFVKNSYKLLMYWYEKQLR